MPAHFQSAAKIAPLMNLETSALPRLSLSRLSPAFLCGLALTLPASLVFAQTSGSWAVTIGGNWSDSANWTGGNIASGSGATVTSVVPTSNTTINLDTNITVGNLNLSGSGSTYAWIIGSTNGSVLTLASGSTPTIQGSANITAVVDGTQGFNFNPGGNRYLTLAGNNIYTGVTTVSNGGIMYLRSNNALGATGAGNGTTINYTSGSSAQLHLLNNITTGEDFTLKTASSGDTGANMIYNDSGNNTIAGNITLSRYTSGSGTTTGVNTFGLQATAGTLTISGNISGTTTAGQASGTVADQTRLSFRPTGATAVIKVTGAISDGTLTASTGAVGTGSNGGVSVYTTADALGTVVLTGANTYTGSTVVNGGTLALQESGSIANSTIYTIAAGAKFDVSGLTVPGYSLANVATTLGVGATTNGFINVGSGILTLGNALTLNFTALPTGGTFNLYDAAGVTGDFTSVTLTGALAGSLTLNGGVWTGDVGGYSLSLAESTGILTVASAVPEPSTVGVLTGIAALGAIALRRRAR